MSSNICKNCNSMLSDSETICPNCGTVVEKEKNTDSKNSNILIISFCCTLLLAVSIISIL